MKSIINICENKNPGEHYEEVSLLLVMNPFSTNSSEVSYGKYVLDFALVIVHTAPGKAKIPLFQT